LATQKVTFSAGIHLRAGGQPRDRVDGRHLAQAGRRGLHQNGEEEDGPCVREYLGSILLINFGRNLSKKTESVSGIFKK
jgi:hypothetical protein